MKKTVLLLCIIPFLFSFNVLVQKDKSQQEKNISFNKSTSINLRKLIIGDKADTGIIIPKTIHTYLSEKVTKGQVIVSINKIKGRAKTKIQIHVLNKNGTIFIEIKYKFPNDKNALKKTWKISNVKGKTIRITLKNTTTTSKFKYTINCV